MNGDIYETCQGLPYGDGQVCVGGEVTPMHLTGKHRDTETNLDDFPARYYSSTQGRWLSPDWDTKPVSVPYAILGNPQTLNLYSYVGGDPTNHADPDGHMNLNALSTANTASWEDYYADQRGQATSVLYDAAQNNNNQQAQGHQSQSHQHGHWEYSQTTGRMTHVLPDGTKQVVGTGYSGKDEGLNNPKAQDKPNVGPIPQGDWKIGSQKDNVTGQGHKLPASMRLDPSKDTEVFGRSGFLIHGDNSQQNHSTSNGCIILDRPTRNQIGGSGDNNLTVVP
ncbi:MAG: RHS repeat-associated core domain-containing protein [Terriglobales bacterium]